MGWVIRLGLAAILGGLIGIGTALWLAGLTPLNTPASFQDIDVEGWRSDWTIGSEAADPYTRARVARHGLLALTKDEAVYFIRSTDGDGNPLGEACDYEIQGGTFPAEWWSITLYDGESRLPLNEDGALSIDATRVSDASNWSARISPERREDGLWISSRNAESFDVMLRLYRPSAELVSRPKDTLVPPSIDVIACRKPAL